MIKLRLLFISISLLFILSCSLNESRYRINARPDNYYTLAIEDNYDTTYRDENYPWICGLIGSDSLDIYQDLAKINIVYSVYSREFYDSTGQRYEERWYYNRHGLKEN